MRDRIYGFHLLALLAAAIVTFDAHAAKATVIQDIEAIQLTDSDYRALSAAQVRAAIKSAATALGWTVTAETAEAIQLRLERSSDRASYWVEIQLPYTEGAFGIYYLDSDGLQFRERGSRRVIHGSYRRWIDNLISTIRQSTGGTLPVSTEKETLD